VYRFLSRCDVSIFPKMKELSILLNILDFFLPAVQAGEPMTAKGESRPHVGFDINLRAHPFHLCPKYSRRRLPTFQNAARVTFSQSRVQLIPS
jgi:hypothetical protein